MSACLTYRHIAEAMEQIAPPALAEPDDNIGLLLGSPADSVSCILLCLDVDDDALDAARKAGAQLIISHHAPIYRPISTLSAQTLPGHILTRAARMGVGIYSAHTNLDRAPGGVADSAALALGFTSAPSADDGFGRVLQLPRTMRASELAQIAADAFDAHGAWVCGNPDAAVSRALLVPGSGGSAVSEAAALGCEALLTGEARHHDALFARMLGIALIQLGHDCTENPVLQNLERNLHRKLSVLECNFKTVIFGHAQGIQQVFPRQ